MNFRSVITMLLVVGWTCAVPPGSRLAMGQAAATQPPSALAQPPAAATQPPAGATTSPASSSPIDLAAFAELKSRVEQAQLSDEEKAGLLEIVARGETQLRDAASIRETAAAQQAAVATVADRVADTKSELEKLRGFSPESPAGMKLTELELLMADVEKRLTQAKQDATDAASGIAKSPQIRQKMETDIADLEKQLAERGTQIEAAAAATEKSLESEVKLAELRSSQEFLQAKIEGFRSEIALIDAESMAGLPQLTKDVLDRQAETLEQQFAVVKTALEQERAKDAAERVEAANEQISTLHPALVPIGQQNRQWAELNQQIAVKIEEVQASLVSRTTELERIQHAFEQATNRVDSVGLTDAVGAQLRNLKQGLPRVGVLRLRSKERQPTINEAQFELIDLTDRRNTRMSIAIDALFRVADPPIPFDQRERIEEEARELLQEQRTEFLDPLIRNQTTYFNTLVSISTTEQQIIDLANVATLYVNKRILWIRSSKPLAAQYVPPREEWWFITPTAWSNVPSRIGDELKSNFALWAVVLLGIIAGLRTRARLRRQLRELGDAVTKSNYTDFTTTLTALVLALLASGLLPLFLWFASWRLGGVAGNDQATMALANFASLFAIGYFPVQLTRQVCRPGGLAEFYFEFPREPVAFLRRKLRWAEWITIPLLALASFLSVNSWGFGRDVLERYLFMAAMVSVGWLVVRLLHPQRGLTSGYLRNHPDGWASHLTYLWYPLAVGVPVAFVVLTTVGYYFTSQQLGWRLFQSICLLLLITLIVCVVLRWVMLHRRKLRIEELREQRQAEVPDKVADVPIALTTSAEELQAQMQQTRRLLRTVMIAFALIGLWLVWRDVTPALGFLDQWPVWTSTETITETITGEDGKETTETREVPDKVTVDELVVAMLIVIVTIAAVRNVPGLLEFSVLRRLPLNNSTRYAITSLVSYAIVLIGLIIACRRIGLHWNQIQWMATALTFGLAFGLQEMFANFVAGIIILFEQPVRVGDVVEIDGVTGVVTKIRIRATTITNWDRKDYIVPNKEFITGKLLNWTRSDDVSRVTVAVGIAYGSDTARARELILKVATEHPNVLTDPMPTAIFEGFGDNSLNFVLRAQINSYRNKLSVTDELHTAIDNAFREAEIEIAFPQRDLHLRSLPEGFQVDASGTAKNEPDSQAGEKTE